MKKMFLSVAIMLSLTLCFGCGKEEDTNSNNSQINNDIESSKELEEKKETKIVKSETQYLEGKKIYEKKFDNNGNLIEYEGIDSTSTEKKKWEYGNEYDSANKLIKQNVYYHDVLMSYNLYEYDNNDNLIKESVYYDDGLNNYTEYEYNSEGDVILETLRADNGVQLSSCEYQYEYNEEGKKVKRKYRVEGGSWTDDYDEDGNIIKSTFKSSNLNNPNTTEYTYKYTYY